MGESSGSLARSLADAVGEEMRSERAECQSGPDSAAGRELAAIIGANVARHRAAHGFDVETLAERSRILVENLRLIEAGQAIPGLRMMWRLASALRVPYGALIEGSMLSETADPDFRVQRAGRGRVIATPGGLRSRPLSSGAIGQRAELYDLTLSGGAEEEAEGHAPGTHEHIVVTAGRLAITVGERSAELEAGDAILFKADEPHGYRNAGSGEVRALLVMLYE